ncbi:MULTISPECIES: hypothetical protein [unclassified Mycoplasma]|uniref:hypothetical protein n=1 Tax=unclassified Mycoplasma TaxID=2683645 RepID=UPI00211CA5BF|nr:MULTISPECIES: hypothetical protein [unclassified Mycoplasma]UUM20109.1 hypothetical protein NPA11_01640 [Mycoplasma sp. 1578d]UUM25089.1 hypothetical protein NPA12_01615 [Mycoplasma sp. 3686d]
MAHVFIVNEQTFKVHLEYMFAGTGNSISDINFLVNKSENTQAGTQMENIAISMLSDLERIRIGDDIIFFVTGISRFFGIFKATSEVYIDNVKNNYLQNELGKTLTYRIDIKPDIVFQHGISEFELLDSLNEIRMPQDMCWSLIYRKLKGERGCTPIKDYEFKRFKKLISKNNKILQGKHFTYDSTKKIIVPSAKTNAYLGKKLNPLPTAFDNLIFKFGAKKAFENYVQLWTLNTLKTNPHIILDKKIPLKWIGNEVSCGVGMQKIDCMTIQEENDNIYISLIELKDETIKPDSIVLQIERYLKWILDYLVPIYQYEGKKITIDPIIIGVGYKTPRKQSEVFEKLNKYIFKHNNKNLVVNKIKLKLLSIKKEQITIN